MNNETLQNKYIFASTFHSNHTNQELYKRQVFVIALSFQGCWKNAYPNFDKLIAKFRITFW